MTRQVLELGGLHTPRAAGREPCCIDPGLIAGGGVAYLRHIERVGSSLRIRLAATASDRPDRRWP